LKYITGYEFESSEFDTWLDSLANLGGSLVGYILIWLWKYARKKTWVAQVFLSLNFLG